MAEGGWVAGDFELARRGGYQREAISMPSVEIQGGGKSRLGRIYAMVGQEKMESSELTNFRNAPGGLGSCLNHVTTTSEEFLKNTTDGGISRLWQAS
jgi:hypothetical protein